MEKRRCKFCGMRGPKIVPHEPCHACKTDGSGSHIISAGTHRRRSAVEARHLDHTANSSDSVLLGPRPITPERAAKRIDNPPRVSRLPPGIIRLPAPAKNAATTVPRREPFERPSSGLGMRPSERVIHDSSSCLSLSSLFHRRPNSPINQPSCVTPAQVLTPPFPQMRGGAESPGEISPTLFWLAGGTGRKPIKFSGWKQSRPKQRMGGLFGMAVFGDRYGQEYTVEANIVEDAEVECSASMKVTIGNEEVEGGAVTSSSISASSSCASPKADSVKEIAAVAEEAVPEPVVEPVQQGLTPPPNEPADDVPLCSGALPVEPTADAPDDIAAPSPPTDGKVQADDAIVIEEKKPHET